MLIVSLGGASPLNPSASNAWLQACCVGPPTPIQYMRAENAPTLVSEFFVQTSVAPQRVIGM